MYEGENWKCASRMRFPNGTLRVIVQTGIWFVLRAGLGEDGSSRWDVGLEVRVGCAYSHQLEPGSYFYPFSEIPCHSASFLTNSRQLTSVDKMCTVYFTLQQEVQISWSIA